MVAQAYGGADLTFGRNYLIPKPSIPVLIVKIARRGQLPSIRAWPRADRHGRLCPEPEQFVQSGFIMKPVFLKARPFPAEKERGSMPKGGERVLRAVRAVVLDEKPARPVLIGRPAVIDMRIEKSACARGGSRF